MTQKLYEAIEQLEGFLSLAQKAHTKAEKTAISASVRSLMEIFELQFCTQSGQTPNALVMEKVRPLCAVIRALVGDGEIEGYNSEALYEVGFRDVMGLEKAMDRVIKPAGQA